MSELESLAKLPFRYLDPEAIDRALEIIPLEQIHLEAEQYGDDFTGGLVRSLLKWFKQWFQWVNSAPCRKCQGGTQGRGGQRATPEEQKYGAGHAEIFWCSQCRIETRFPRYNDPVKLLETRSGRCGEWANVMTLLLNALDLEVRYVWNAEDHVWNEYYSEYEQRWIHIDSCEEAYDKPLIYSDGWGKKMSYVVGFSVYGVKDITKRYVRRSDVQLPRTRFPEPTLAAFCITTTAKLRSSLAQSVVEEWADREILEDGELASYEAANESNQAELPRQSGSAEWVQSRGENGD